MNKASGGDRIPVELFQILKDDAMKVLHSIVSIFGKLSSGHRTGNCQFSFQSQRRAMPKNVQTTLQFHSFHMLAKLCSKSFKIGFSSTPENFEMYQLGLEKAEKPEIKLPTIVGSWKKQENSKKKSIHFCFIDYTKAFHYVDHKKLWKILRDGNTRPPDLPLEKYVCRSGSNS